MAQVQQAAKSPAPVAAGRPVAAPKRAPAPGSPAALQMRLGNRGVQLVLQRRAEASASAARAEPASPAGPAADERSAAQKQADLDAGIAEAKLLAADETIDIDKLPPFFDAIKAKYRMKVLEIQRIGEGPTQEGGTIEIKGEVNPGCFMRVIRKVLRFFGCPIPTPASAAAAAAQNAALAAGLPQYIANFRRGTAFNRALYPAYPVQELYVNKPGGGYYRLDSYDAGRGEIVSRKNTQLAAVQQNTAFACINELVLKYPPGRIIANVPSSGALAGQPLVGTMILEVPVQDNPVPAAVLAHAAGLNVVIRDDDGDTY